MGEHSPQSRSKSQFEKSLECFNKGNRKYLIPTESKKAVPFALAFFNKGIHSRQYEKIDEEASKILGQAVNIL